METIEIQRDILNQVAKKLIKRIKRLQEELVEAEKDRKQLCWEIAIIIRNFRVL